jgi:hypothetical protein
MEETSIVVDPDRLLPVTSRQLSATLSTHHCHVFAVELTQEEMDLATRLEQQNQVCRQVEETEQTYIIVRTVRQIMASDCVDWAVLGMIGQALNNQ